jgi:hypothetical protein
MSKCNYRGRTTWRCEAARCGAAHSPASVFHGVSPLAVALSHHSPSRRRVCFIPVLHSLITLFNPRSLFSYVSPSPFLFLLMWLFSSKFLHIHTHTYTRLHRGCAFVLACVRLSGDPHCRGAIPTCEFSLPSFSFRFVRVCVCVCARVRVQLHCRCSCCIFVCTARLQCRSLTIVAIDCRNQCCLPSPPPVVLFAGWLFSLFFSPFFHSSAPPARRVTPHPATHNNHRKGKQHLSRKGSWHILGCFVTFVRTPTSSACVQ